MRTTAVVLTAALLVAAGPARPAMPPVTEPIPFDDPRADAVLAALQVFPADNPWNADVSAWPVHPGSRAMVASAGPGKPLRYNADMGFVLVPPG